MIELGFCSCLRKPTIYAAPPLSGLSQAESSLALAMLAGSTIRLCQLPPTSVPVPIRWAWSPSPIPAVPQPMRTGASINPARLPHIVKAKGHVFGC